MKQLFLCMMAFVAFLNTSCSTVWAKVRAVSVQHLHRNHW